MAERTPARGPATATADPTLTPAPVLAGPAPTSQARATSTPAPTATPCPVIATATVGTMAARFAITINGVPVGAVENVVAAPFGLIRSSIPPEDDGTYSPGTVVTLTVFSTIKDLKFTWYGVDLPQGDSAIVQMFGDKSVEVRVGSP